MTTYFFLGVLIIIVIVLFILSIEVIQCKENFQSITYTDKEYTLLFSNNSNLKRAKRFLNKLNTLERGSFENNINTINELINIYFRDNIDNELYNFYINNIDDKLKMIGTTIKEISEYADNYGMNLTPIPANKDDNIMNFAEILRNKIHNTNYQNRTQQEQDKNINKLQTEMSHVYNLLKTLKPN